MENIIRIENLIFEYSKETEEGQVSVRAVNDVSFEIEKGSFTAIIGRLILPEAAANPPPQ